MAPFCCSSGYGVIYKYVLIFSFIYEWQSVGGYGIPAIPTLLWLSCRFSGYGKDAIPSYRLPLIYKDKYELVLMPVLEDENDFRDSSLPVYTVKELFDTISLF